MRDEYLRISVQDDYRNHTHAILGRNNAWNRIFTI